MPPNNNNKKKAPPAAAGDAKPGAFHQPGPQQNQDEREQQQQQQQQQVVEITGKEAADKVAANTTNVAHAMLKTQQVDKDRSDPLTLSTGTGSFVTYASMEIVSRPGAHRQGGPPSSREVSLGFSLEDAEGALSSQRTAETGGSDIPSWYSSLTVPGTSHETSQETQEGLAVAERIRSSSSRGFRLSDLRRDGSSALPRAQELRTSQQSQDRRKREADFKVWKRNFLLAGIGVVVLLMILMAVFIPSGRRGGETEEDAGAAATNSSLRPTQAPTSMENYVLSLLPASTGAALEDDPEAPQARALVWLLDDLELNTDTFPEQRLIQRFSLATFFYSTTGDKWANNQNWLDHSVHECEWFNQQDFAAKDTVTKFYPGFLLEFFPTERPERCNANGLYEHLWLDQNNLLGVLPEELYLLTYLKTLSTGLNPLLGGTLSTLIGQLTALEGLFMFNQALSQTIPTQIGLLSNLRGISVYGNRLDGSIPEQFWALTNLSTIGAGLNKFQFSLPTVLGTFPQLRWLELTECGLTGTVPTELGLVSTMQWSPLFDNELTGSIPTELGQMSSLWLLSFSSNNLVGPLPSELGVLPSVFAIDLANNALSGSIPTEYGQLTSIALSLHLGHNSLSGTIPSQLSLLTLLAKLSLQDNQLSGLIPSELGLLSAAMARLELKDNILVGTIPEELSALEQSLHSFSLEGNSLLSGIVPESLCAINRTCISSSLVMVACPENDGLTFDCEATGELCGCECACNGAKRPVVNITW